MLDRGKNRPIEGESRWLIASGCKDLLNFINNWGELSRVWLELNIIKSIF